MAAIRSPPQPSIRTSSSPSGVAGARSGIFSRSAPIWKLNGTWPMRAVSNAALRQVRALPHPAGIHQVDREHGARTARRGASSSSDRLMPSPHAPAGGCCASGQGQQADGVVAVPAQGVVAHERRGPDGLARRTSAVLRRGRTPWSEPCRRWCSGSRRGPGPRKGRPTPGRRRPAAGWPEGSNGTVSCGDAQTSSRAISAGRRRRSSSQFTPVSGVQPFSATAISAREGHLLQPVVGAACAR
jgi:hypothetical protein